MWESAGERIKRRQRELADQNQHKQGDNKPPGTLLLAQYQAALSVELAKISALKTMPERTALKQKLLPTYKPFVWEYVEQQHNYQNNVAVQVMIWLFDVGEIEKALKLAFYLMPHQTMPERFSRRDIQIFVCDALYDWANEQLKANQSALPFIATVADAMDDWQLPIPVRSKVLVMAAKHFNREMNYSRVVELCERAKAVNPEGYGAKSLLTQAKLKL